MDNISPPEILCIYGSPRKGGNTDVLMDAFASGVKSAGGVVKELYLRDMKLFPCREIYACKKTGECVLKDDLTPLFDEIKSVDAIAFASPVMFYSVSAISKAFIDRFQSLWCDKYLLENKVSTGRLKERKGVLLSVGGSRGEKIFDGMRLTFRYFLDTLDALPWGEVVAREVDEKGDMAKRPEILEKSKKLGIELVEAIKGELEQA